jgi:hypothetical protein
MIRHLSDEMAGPSFVFPYVLSVYVEHLRNQYSETNVMHFLFSLLRIKGLYMFRALLPHLQEAFHKRHLVYCVRVMSVGCYHWSTSVGQCLDNETGSIHHPSHESYVTYFMNIVLRGERNRTALCRSTARTIIVLL